MKVGIWLRVSTEEQALTDVLQNHEQKAREYCNFYGYEIVETYVLAGVSGKHVLPHAETQRMLRDVASGKIEGLVFSKLARLARNTRDLLAIADHFRQNKCALMSIGEKIFDTSSNAGELIFTILAALSQWERSEIASRVAAMVPIRAKQKKHLGGAGPFGYSWVEGILLPDPEKMPIVQKAFQTFLENGKIKTTAAILNNMGYRSSKSPWGTTTLKRLLVDPVYKGEYKQNYSKSKGEGKGWVPKDREDWVINEVPAIVPVETWDAVQEKLAARPVTYQTGIPKESSYIYGGLLVCECGTKMYVTKYRKMTNPRYSCNKCRKKVWESDITTAFRQVIQQVILTPEQLVYDNDESQELERKQNELTALKREYEKQSGRLERLVDLLLDAGISKKDFADKRESLNQHMEQIAVTIRILTAELEGTKRAAEGRAMVVAQARTLSTMWDELEYAAQREMAHELLKRVDIKGETLRFTFFWLPEPTGNTEDFTNLPGAGNASIELVPNPQGFMAATSMTREG